MAATYTFLGMSKEEQETWVREMRAGVQLPTTPKFKIKDNDKGKAREAKEKRCKEFLATREKEIQERLKQNDAARVLNGIVFAKDKPVSSDAFVDANGKPVIMLPDARKAFLSKLHGMVRLGVMKRNPPLKGDVEDETELDAEVRPDKKGK